MPGHHHFFCAEWRRLRKVLPIEEELLYEFVVTARSWDNVPLDSGCDFVQANNLVGWMVEVEQDLFEHINDEFAEAVEGDGPKSARGRSTLSRERSMGRRSPRAASRCDRRSLSPARRSTPSRTATRSPTRSCTGLGSVQTSGGPSRPMLFKNPWHPLAKLSDSLGREEFVTELRKRLRAPRLFREAEDLPNAGGAGQGQGDPALTVEECEDLFEALMQLQKIAGASHLNPGVLAFGCNMDETVNTFYGILALRNAVERGAPSLNAFLAGLEAKDSKLVDPTLLRQFLTMVNYRLAGDTGIQDSIPVESIVKAHGEISMQEFRRRLSFAAPVGISLLEVQGHLEAKNGLGRSKLPGMIDFAQLAEHFCGEHLDISPLDLAHFVRLWGAHPGNLLSPQTMDEALERLPLEAYWGLEPFAVEHFFNILGMRCLQLERNKRKDACLPVEAVLEFARRDAPDLEKAEAAVPSDAALKERFEHLWGNCVGEGMLVAFPDGHSERVGSKEKAAHEHKAERRKEKERVGTARMKEACLARYLRSATEIMNQPVSRRQYESIFPNVSDILSVSNVNLRAGQVVVVRYRLAGACNFWHSKHRVLKDEREPLPWPVPGKVLGETPFVALVPRGLRWTNAGGGGFYLGSQSFNQVDPGLRADLPLDRDGKLQLYGTVEMVAPYLLRGSRRNASSATEELEFRLFSSRKNRIIGCVGEPLRVLVSHQALPPAVATLQVCCEGRTAKLRWAGYDFGEDASSEALVDALRLYVRTGSKESLLELETDGKQYELRDLAPDTDYEFHLRRESASSGGVEASCSCRTNARCSQPLNVLSAKASTTYVDLQWRAPEVVGNERTQDRWQLQCESIRRYEARLSVAEKLMDRRALARSRTSVQLREEVDTSCRQCSWEVGHFAAQEGLLTGRLGGLRPDTNYLLSGFCAVNSMGAGATAKELQFWTMPLNPVIESIRVRQGNVILTLLETGGEHVDEFEAVVRLEDGAERSFTLPKSALHGETPELSLEFQQMPESRSSDAVHCVKLRACNAGGWSTWSEELSTSAIARQQGADYAQNALEQAMEQRVPEKLARVLQDVRDIEFDDKSLVSEASDLLNILQTVQKEVEEAMAARDPDRLQNSLSDAHKVFLPGLEQAEGLLGTLQRVCQNLDTAKGIDALRASLREGHEARLPPTLLQRAVQRLGTREAAQQGLEMAMEAARVPVLRAALDTALDMHLPSEEAARRLLLAISGSERLLQAALESEDIGDLHRALDSAARSGLREEELMARAQRLLARQLEKQQDATRALTDAIEARFPSQLKDALDISAASQVEQAKMQEGADLLLQLESLLADVEAAVGSEQRSASLRAAVNAKVPHELLAIAEKQLHCLTHLHQVCEAGDVPATRRALKLAEVAGVKDQEVAELRQVHQRWSHLTQELEIAVSMANTARLRQALANTENSNICQEQLQPAAAALAALQRSDQAAVDLAEALDTCDAEIIQKSLQDACNNNVVDSDLLFTARQILDNLLRLRQQLAKAVESMDLQRLFAAVQEAQKDDGLPEKDLASACHILEELKEGELGRLERHLRQAAEAEDFRALQGLLHRARNAAALGVQVEQLDLENYRQLAHQQQEANIRKLQEDIHKQRIRNDWPAVYDKIEEGEEAEELEVEVVQLPAVVVSGEVQLDLYPRGIQKEFITLPREIVEAKIRIPLPDLSPDKEPVMEARQSLDALLESLRAMLAEEDELRRIGSMEIQDDGAYRDVTLPISLYLSARTSCQEVIEAFFRDPEDEPGRENSKGYRRSKSMSKRHAIKALWSCLSELGHSRSPELRSHCLHDVRGRVLRRITAELFWTQPASYRETMDATCVAMSADGLVEVVNARGVHGAYYGVDQGAFRVQSKGVDALFGAVSHLGTARAEAGSDLQSSLEGKMVCKQQMQVRLDLLPERVTDIFFLLAATNSRELGKFTHLGFRIADTDIGTTLAMQEDHRVQLTFEAVVIMCAIYKLGDGYWRIGSMNVSSSGSPRDLKAAIAKLEALGFPRKHETSSQENMVVDSVRRYLELPRSAVKAANVDIDSASTMTVQYAIEASDTAKGEQLEEKLKGNLHEAILDEFFKFTNEKVKPERLRVMPAAAKPLGHLHLEVRWEFGEVKRTDSKDHSYLDGALITFSGRCLQEIVDYRGPHGVRIVHNGVVDYDGMWIGPVGKSDAANRAIKHEGLVLDELPRTGKTSFEVRLDQLPPSTTDIYVVVSSPSGRELSKYSNIAVAAVDAWKSHQVCNCLLKSKPASQGVIFCRLSRSASGWKMGALRTPTSGGCHDFAPALECLRKIQGAGTSQAHQISIGDNGSRSERRLLPMKQLRSKGEKLQRQMSSGSISSLLTWSPARNPNSRRLGAAEMD
ncbi:unnamed protein product [Effrenium voratum]|uniref:Uncharacterized protein n=1 Tax=Effrenium voratum TaxID=2562239 RepID=A0AA36HRM3_9DINO|nr:unnamed protein product [Effrenium voratum]